MHLAVSIRILGVLLMAFSTAMLPSLGLGLVAQDGSASTFLLSFVISMLAGLLLWLPMRKRTGKLRIRDGFLVTAMFWSVLGVFGCLPFYLSTVLHLTLPQAIFESISGLTTTGATVITGLDNLPRSILLYRQLLQWMGGIGVIVLAVAVLPMLGISGMQLFRAEATGPSKEGKLTPRIADTAKALFSVYLGLTAICFIAYWLAGMGFFDAICHALTTVSTGGFSTHDASMGYFESNLILLICIVFMTIGSVSFGLHYLFLHRRSLAIYRNDSETSFFSLVVVLATLIVSVTLIINEVYSAEESLIHGLFQTVSVITSTGYGTRDFTSWPTFVPVLLLTISFMGGCAGSTAGGMKSIRILLIWSQGLRELKQILHPNAIIPLKLDARRVQPHVVSAVWSYFALYVFCFIGFLLLMLAMGLDFTTAFSAVATSMNNLGPGLGEIGSNFIAVSDTGKLLMCLAMLLGRLEVFTLLVLFTPAFWRP